MPKRNSKNLTPSQDVMIEETQKVPLFFNEIKIKFIPPEKHREFDDYLKDSFNHFSHIFNTNYLKTYFEGIPQKRAKKEKIFTKESVRIDLENSMSKQFVMNYGHDAIPNFSKEASVSSIVDGVKKLQAMINDKISETLMYYIHIGRLFSELNEKCHGNKEELIQIVQNNNLKYNSSMIYFLIQLSEKAHKHPELQRVQKSLYYMKTNWKYISELFP